MSESKRVKAADVGTRQPARPQQKLADQRQFSVHLQQLQAMANASSRTQQQRKIAPLAASGIAPVQAVTFSRRWSSLMWTDAEREIDRKERMASSFQEEMRPHAARFPDITRFGVELKAIHDTQIAEDQMQATLDKLNTIQNALDNIASSIAQVGMLAGDDVMMAHSGNAADSKAGQITQIIVNTIGVLPEVFHSGKNHQVIKSALHPDIESSVIGLTDDYLGDSDVSFARTRHSQILVNLLSLEQKIRNDWGMLQATFHLTGALGHIELTGSDLHKEGQQVVIIASTGGQKVVYKPRSVAPDAALLDASTGAFVALNKIGASLPTMNVAPTDAHAGYTEFVQRTEMKSHQQIQEYYRQMGQLVVAAKLFGVNDLHYENIMAAGTGPTIIDAETSFLLNVMTARNFQSNELQSGLFTHVSVIDDKLSNNAFYTMAEKAEWEQLGRKRPAAPPMQRT